MDLFCSGDRKKLRAKIRRYEKTLKSGDRDRYGKRYLLGQMYLVMGDLKGALQSFQWYDETYPNDIGDPHQYHFWGLALLQNKNYKEATIKMRQAMFMNLYIIPFFIGLDQEDYPIWHGSNLAGKEYAYYMPELLLDLWRKEDLEWLIEFYNNSTIKQDREEFIRLGTQLNGERPGPKRSEVLKKMRALENKLLSLGITPLGEVGLVKLLNGNEKKL